MKRILLIDDQIREWKLIYEILKEFNVEIYWMPNLARAREFLCLSAGLFDLVLIDFLGTTVFNDFTEDLYLISKMVPKEKIVITSSAAVPQESDFKFVDKRNLPEFLEKELNL